MSKEDYIINMLMNNPRMKNSPVVQNAFTMYRNNDLNGLMGMAHNLEKEKGVSINDTYKNVCNQFGLK